MALSRRVVLSGLALPAIVGVTVPKMAEQTAPTPGLPILNQATHDAVLTQATAQAFSSAGIKIAPAAPAVEVPNAPHPSWRITLSVGSVAFDLLTGVVHFDGGILFTSATTGQVPRLALGSFASQLAKGEASGSIWLDKEPRGRITVFTFDLTQATIDVAAPNIALGKYSLTLTQEAVDIIKEVFPDAPANTTEPFATGSATGLFELPVLQETSAVTQPRTP